MPREELSVSAASARGVARLVADAAHGDEVVVTRHHRPVAAVVGLERLRELEEEGILSRKVIPESPVRVEYALTKKGRALEPTLAALGTWAQQWIEDQIAASSRR